MKLYKNQKAILFTIEGFDRTGKRTLLKNLKNKFNKNNVYVYTVPKDYNKPDFLNKKAYAKYLAETTKKQMADLISLSYDYDIIIQKDFLVSDMVFSTLFHREQTVNQYMDEINQHFTVVNIITLFNSYADYIKRINKIHQEVKYNILDYKLVNVLFKNITKKCFNDFNELFHVHFQKYFTSPNTICKDIYTYINSMSYILFSRNNNEKTDEQYE